MSVFGALDLISEQFSFMDKKIKFCMPFVIISSSSKIVFVSYKFSRLQKENSAILDFIIKNIHDSNSIELKFDNLNISYKIIATLPKGEKLFVVCVIDSTITNCDNGSWSIAKYCHDVQEPLRNISNFLQLIKIKLLEKYDPETIEYIDYAIGNIVTLSAWNKELLGKNNITSSAEPLTLPLIIEEIKRLLKTLISNRNCQINLKGEFPEIKGQYFEILSVFKNLIENSLKHAKTDFLVINISLIEVSDSRIKILFCDNGKGLSLEEKKKIENAINGNNSNNNFGISICRNILLNHSGSIKFLNQEIGCAYEITLLTF